MHALKIVLCPPKCFSLLNASTLEGNKNFPYLSHPGILSSCVICVDMLSSCSSSNSLTTPLTEVPSACHCLSCPGVAVWRQHGGPPLRQGGAHRAHQEALQQRHRLLRQAKCPARRRGLDGRVQIPRLHGLEHPHERRSVVLFLLLPPLPWPPSPDPFSRPRSLARLFMQTRMNKRSLPRLQSIEKFEIQISSHLTFTPSRQSAGEPTHCLFQTDKGGAAAGKDERSLLPNQFVFTHITLA